MTATINVFSAGGKGINPEQSSKITPSGTYAGLDWENPVDTGTRFVVVEADEDVDIVFIRDSEDPTSVTPYKLLGLTGSPAKRAVHVGPAIVGVRVRTSA